MSAVTNADLRNLNFLRQQLPVVWNPENAAQIAVGRNHGTHDFHAAIIGQRAGQDVVWKGPAIGTTREIALTRLLAQVEELIMDHMRRRIGAENISSEDSDGEGVSDDHSDAEVASDRENDADRESEGGDFPTGGSNQEPNRKRKNEGETSDGSVAKRRKAKESSAGSVSFKHRKRNLYIEVIEEVADEVSHEAETTGPSLESDNDDTAMAETSAETTITTQVSMPIGPTQSAAENNETGKEPSAVGPEERRKTWVAKLALW